MDIKTEIAWATEKRYLYRDHHVQMLRDLIAEQDKTIRDLEDELQEQRGVSDMRLEEAGVTVAEQAAKIKKLEACVMGAVAAAKGERL